MCCISVLKLTTLLNICVENELQGLLMIRLLKCFVSPTQTYTAQHDENVMHIPLILITLLGICVEHAL